MNSAFQRRLTSSWMRYICHRHVSEFSSGTKVPVYLRCVHKTINRPLFLFQIYHNQLSYRQISEEKSEENVVEEEDTEEDLDSWFDVTDNKQYKILGSKTLASFKEKCLNHNLKMTVDDWRDLENQVIEDNPHARKALEATIMSLLFSARNMNLAESFLAYIKQQGLKPNRATLSTFIAMCGTCCGKDKQDLIYEAYEDLLKHSSLLDFYTIRTVITGISATDRWRLCLELLEMATLTGKPTTIFYSPVVSASLREGDWNVALELLQKMGNEGIRPKESVFQDFIKALSEKDSVLSLKSLMDILRKHHWLIVKDTAVLLEHYLQRTENLTTRLTHVDKRGVCRNCGHQLDRNRLSHDQFRDLQRHLLENVLVGENVYLQSHPEEVQELRDFVQKNAPFDIVLDALNIVYNNAGGKNTNSSKSAQLRRVVEHFAVDRGRRVAVIGRKHMLKWNRKDMQAVERVAATFYTDNESKDDPFSLFAAIYSGPRCLIMSQDQMRDHKFRLGSHRKEVFEQWQRSHQIVPVKSAGRPSYLMPSGHDTGPQTDPGGYHIPFDDNQERPAYMRPNTWLCVRSRM